MIISIPDIRFLSPYAKTVSWFTFFSSYGRNFPNSRLSNAASQPTLQNCSGGCAIVFSMLVHCFHIPTSSTTFWLVAAGYHSADPDKGGSIQLLSPNAAPYTCQPPTLRQSRMVLLCLLILCGLAGCGSSPYVAPQHRIANADDGAREPPSVVRAALAQLDRPYRYGGDTPRGFDCSGLVYYAYQLSGLEIPRTSLGQLRATRPIPLRQLAPGDLLFFRERKKQASHVGLYIGEGRFVHASTSEQAVVLSHLANPYWKKHLMSAGRYDQ